MVKINKELLRKIASEGFFDNQKDVEEVAKRLSQKGFKVHIRKMGLLSQLLTFLCQEGILEREESNEGKGKWKYRKA